MGCAITSAVFGGIIIICFSISIAMYRTSPWYEDDFYQRYWYNYDAEMAVTVITLILGIVEFGIGIWAAVLCCNMNACQCCAVQGGQVLYIYWVNFALSAPLSLCQGLSTLATELFISTNFLSWPTFYKCGWFVAT